MDGHHCDYRKQWSEDKVNNAVAEVIRKLVQNPRFEEAMRRKISEDNVYQFLLYFDKLYDRFIDLEKKEFLNSFVESIDIYEQEQPDGRLFLHYSKSNISEHTR